MGDNLKALPDIDVEAYTTMANKFRSMRDGIKTGITTRRGYLNTALDGWSGEAAKSFVTRFTVGDTDALELVGMLDATATALDGPQATSMKESAKRENRRRKAARDWLAKRDQYKKDHPKHWYNPADWFSSDDWESKIGPMPSDIPEPEPDHTADTAPPKRPPAKKPNTSLLV